MTTIRFLRDSDIELHDAMGRVVSLSHRAGEVVEAGDSLARLYLSDGAAVRVPDTERAIAPKGEQR